MPSLFDPSMQGPGGGNRQPPAKGPKAPKLKGFLANLGAGMGSAQPTQPAPMTPYPISGTVNLLNALTTGAQNFSNARAAVEQAQMGAMLRRIRQSKASQDALQMVESGDLSQMQPGHEFLLAMQGLPIAQAPVSSRGERAKHEAVRGGTAVSADTGATIAAGAAEGKAERDLKQEIHYSTLMENAGQQNLNRILEERKVKDEEARTAVAARNAATAEREATDRRNQFTSGLRVEAEKLAARYVTNSPTNAADIRALVNHQVGLSPLDDTKLQEVYSRLEGVIPIDQMQAETQQAREGLKASKWQTEMLARAMAKTGKKDLSAVPTEVLDSIAYMSQPPSVSSALVRAEDEGMTNAKATLAAWFNVEVNDPMFDFNGPQWTFDQPQTGASSGIKGNPDTSRAQVLRDKLKAGTASEEEKNELRKLIAARQAQPEAGP